MRACIRCFDGAEYELPAVLEWKFSYGLGAPCDAFELTCVWDPGAEKAMAAATRFWATEAGERVFTGIVDEYRCVRDESGSRLEVSGRGMQGLLLDNETLPVEYQKATLKDIVRSHVAPYGIETVGGDERSVVKGFVAASGQSEWSVLRGFVSGHHGVVPYFDRMGRLILSGWEDREQVLVDNASVITRLAYGEKRYGVFSQVVVRDRSKGTTTTVQDEAFLKQGGMCRRVLSVSENSASSSLRDTGEYQLRASCAERVCCEMTVAGLFCAFPGQLVKVERSGFGGNGIYRVAEAVTGVNEQGAYTELVLRETDLLV